ncbi:MAG: hypothetical protein C0467_03515 [Planctomycetaceae bacterium]|nr:hypothetical protein [Planctomycetaceae bacterium]
MVGGFAAFAATYIVYSQMLGWLDGLPILPPSKLIASTDRSCVPPVHLTSPTIELIKVAFGEKCPEAEPGHYPTQLRFLQGDTTIVFAAGSPPSNPNSNRIALSPFSVAMFGKPRPEHLRTPGEVTEISTIHADRAVLEFDRVIQSATEMNNAKLVRLELISDPEQAIPDSFQRVGKVHITNNQRSADPNRRLVLRTVGPMFYRDSKVAPGAPPLTGPDIWTDSAVEIVDRSNLPRQPGEPAVAAPATAEEVRNPTAVAAMLGGKRLPPPTVTAVGMRVYLEPQSQAKKPAQPKTPAAGSAGFGGVQRVEFLEKVVMNLWVDGGQQGFVGGGEGKPAISGEPTVAASALAGGLLSGAHAARAMSRDLLQVETRGPFVYDSVKNLARFDVLPLADPNLPNDVQVTKVPPRPGTQTLFSQVLELEFNGPPTGNPSTTATPAKPAEKPEPTAKAAPASAPKFKRLHAWTYTQGRFLTVSSDADQLEAYGQDLVHEAATARTQLTGAPLYAIQQRNVLTAGGPKQSAILVLDQPPNPPGPVTQPRKMQATVLGPGRVELYDAASNSSSITASWLTSMVQTRESTSERELDLFTFTDGAKFEDVKSDFWLKGNVLKLWLTVPPPEPKSGAVSATPPARSQPHRLQALGEVTGHSADMDIDQSEHLNTLFRDVAPPVAVTAVVAPTSPAAPPKGNPQQPPPQVAAAPVTPAPKAPEKQKPPMKLRARTIETWVARYPQAKPPGGPVAPKPGEPAATDQTGGMKYQMEKARCEGMVSVHQDPVDATKPRGTDILGSRMIIDSTPDGSVLTVFGWDNRPGELHNEGTSLIGPKVVIDQLHNLALVEGRGSLVMPTSSDLSGNSLKQAEVIVVHFRDGMKFQGAKKVADFFGKVTAAQGASWVTCHTLQVNFDRPIYLTQMNRPGTPAPAPKPGATAKPGGDGPKVDVVYCYPAPADAADSPQEKQVYFNQVDRDPVSGKPIRRQQIVAIELTMKAEVRDPSGGEPYKFLRATGPGVVRTWQPGSKEDSSLGQSPMANPMNPPQPAQSEMKLTIVNFSGWMIGKDKGPVYKDATFYDSIQVIDVPSDNPDLEVELHKLPPRATLLSCAEQLVVWTHSKPKEPTEQHMKATGNAYMRNDEYDGWGESIEAVGKTVIFEGLGSVPARIKSRFNGNDQTGKKIIFDRATNHYKVEGSLGGTLSPSAGTPKPAPKK